MSYLDMRDIKQLIRVYRRADKIHLSILACAVRRALTHIANKEYGMARERLRDAERFCGVAESGTEEAQLFAPGARAVISRVIENLS